MDFERKTAHHLALAMAPRFLLPLSLLLCFWLGTAPLNAVIFFSTAAPAKNTTAPAGKLAGSGWQYTGSFGPFAATAIDPHYFITVKHIGTPSNVFTFRGVDYPIVQSFDDPVTELRIFQISGSLPAWAPLYSRSNEAGLGLVVIGRGTQRGAPLYTGGTLRGWEWGAADGVQRWGQNVVTRASGSDLYAAFDQGGTKNEATLSTGDSSGGVFINDNGKWKLAGVSYGVDPPVSTALGGATFNAALFDLRGFYESGILVSGSKPVPSGFLAVRISSQLAWIRTIVPNAGSSGGSNSNTAEMSTPAPGSVLPGSAVTFTWTAGSARAYKLFVGNAPGAADIYNSGKLTVRTLRVRNIPTNGATIYVRLWSRVNGSWVFVDYTYQAY